MHRPLTAFVVLFLGGSGVGAQAHPTRFQALTAVLEARERIYEQGLIVDECSVATMVDSVKTSVGTPGPRFAAAVVGVPGNCLQLGVVPSGRRRVLTAHGLLRGAPFVPEIDPEELKSFFTLIVRVTNRGSGHFVVEEWALKPLKNGELMVIAVRSSIGTD